MGSLSRSIRSRMTGLHTGQEKITLLTIRGMQNLLCKNEECIIMVMLVIASGLFDQGLLNRIRSRSLSYRFPHTVNIANDFFRD